MYDLSIAAVQSSRSAAVAAEEDVAGGAAKCNWWWSRIARPPRRSEPRRRTWWRSIRSTRGGGNAWRDLPLPGLAQGAAGQRRRGDLGPSDAGPDGPTRPRRRRAEHQLGGLSAAHHHPGQVHVLEIEYPSDVPQAMGISLVEPNAAGAVMPIGLDSGVYVSDEEAENPPQTGAAPRRLLAAHQDAAAVDHQSPAGLAGRVWQDHGVRRVPIRNSRCSRWAASESGEPVAAGLCRGRARERLWAGYLDRPLVRRKLFGARGARPAEPPQPGRLEHVLPGRHAAGEVPAARGLQRFDALGAGRRQHDLSQPAGGADAALRHGRVLRQPARIRFARMRWSCCSGCSIAKRLMLIPALHFAVAAARAGRRSQRAGGAKARASNGSAPTAAPGWPPTARGRDWHLTTTCSIRACRRRCWTWSREVAERYGSHESFGGVALQLSAEGYAQLPGEDWGFDDRTIARFERETGTRVPGSGRRSGLPQRAQFLAGPGARPGSRGGPHAWPNSTAGCEHEIVTAASRRQAVSGRRHDAGRSADAVSRCGPRCRAAPGSTKRWKSWASGRKPIAATAASCCCGRNGCARLQRPAGGQAADLEIYLAPEMDRLFASGRQTGSLFYHEPQKARLASFDVKSPFGAANTYTWLVSEMSPSGDRTAPVRAQPGHARRGSKCSTAAGCCRWARKSRWRGL